MTTATLGFAIDSSQTVKAKTDLDRMTEASTKAELAQQRLTAASAGSNAGLAKIAAGVEQANVLLAKLVAITDANTVASTKLNAARQGTTKVTVDGARASGLAATALRQEAVATDLVTAAMNRHNAAERAMGGQQRAREAAGTDVWGRTASERSDVRTTSLATAANQNRVAPIAVTAPAAAQIAEAAAVTRASAAGIGATSAFKSALVSLISPATAIQFLLFSVAGAAVQYFSTAESASKKFENNLQAHAKAVQELGKAYRDTSMDMDEVQRKTVVAAEALERLRRAELNRDLKKQTEALSSNLSTFSLGTYLPEWMRSSNVTPVFAPFTEATEKLRDGLKRDKPDFDAFEKQIQSISDTDPGKLRQWGDVLIDMAQKVAQARRELGLLDEFNRNGRGGRVVGPAAMDDRAAAGRAILGEQRTAREQAQRIQQEQLNAELDMMRARTNAQRLAAIEAKVRAEPAGENDPGVEVRVHRALSVERTKQAVEERNASIERDRSQKRSIESGKEELSLIGLTVGETAKLNYQYSELARLKEEAAKRGGIVSDDEVRKIKEAAVELGKIAAARARMNLDNDLAFERSQMFLSPQEQAIASKLRGTGIGMNSSQADEMRSQNQFQDAKDLANGFLSDFGSELLDSGGDLGKALGHSILNALTNSMSKQWEAIFDKLATGFASALTGQTAGGGGASAAFGTASGFADMLMGGASNDNYSKGAVTRAPLGAVGSDMASYIQQAATARGIDPSVALKVARSEGLAAGVWQSNAMKNGIREPSYGPFQLLKGGAGTGYPTGMGNDFMKQTGLDPANPANAYAGVDFALDGAAKNGWGAWYGAKAAGIGNREGLGGASAIGIDKSAAAIDKLTTGSTNAAKGLDSLGNGMGKMGNALSQFPSAPGGGGGSGILGGLLGGLSSVFKGTKAFNWLSANPGGSIGLYADGTENAPPGWAWVGEEGPELKKLRAGDVIRSNPASMQMAANGNRSQSQSPAKMELHVHVNGGSGDDHVRMLATQAGRQLISEYNESQTRGGFGEMSRRFASQKG